jgi:hypothetical protein
MKTKVSFGIGMKLVFDHSWLIMVRVVERCRGSENGKGDWV